MTFSYKNTGAWGAGNGGGVGGRLTSLQGDNNVYGLLLLIQALQAAGPKEISDITVSGGALTIHLSDGSTKGPFVLPIAKLQFKGVWQNDTLYHYLDLVWVRALGLFLVNVDHTTPAAPAEFDPAADDGTTAHDLLYTQFAPLIDVDYDVSFSLAGAVPGDNPLLLQLVLRRPVKMRSGLSGAYAFLRVATSVETLVFSLRKNEVEIGTLTFAPGVSLSGSSQFGVFAFSADVSFAASDRFSLHGPSSTDADAADLSVTIPSTRMDV